MKTMLLVLSAVLMTSTVSHATAMSETKSKCLSMEKVADDYSKWKTGFGSYLEKFSDLEESERYELSQKATLKFSSLAKRLYGATNDKNFDKLSDDARENLRIIGEKDYTERAAAIQIRKSLVSLEVVMDDALSSSQVKNPYCELVPKRASAVKSASSAGIPGVK